MPFGLFFALAGVYALGIAGVALAGSIVEPEPYEPGSLDERLASARDASDAPTAATIMRPRRSADAAIALARVIESIARQFEPVVARQMRSDVAASGSVRTARSS